MRASAIIGLSDNVMKGLEKASFVGAHTRMRGEDVFGWPVTDRLGVGPPWIGS